MKDDDIPVVGLMVDLETALFVFVALTKPATSLDCWCPNCRWNLPDVDAETRDRVRERMMEIVEALEEQMDSVQLVAALPPDAMKHLVATSSGGPHSDAKTWATRRLPWPWAIGCTTLDILVTGLFIARVSQRSNPMFIDSLLAGGLQFMSALFISCVGLGAAVAVGLFVMDISQTRDAVRRNYPVIGRFRYVFSMLGEFFRQYFFAMDREEMPFNRAERDWVDRSARESNNTVAFGSTKNLTATGSVIFVNCAFPTLTEDAVDMVPMEIGPHCRYSYVAPSFFNISGMSYGALSTPAVKALSRGAAQAGCWLNTGEGGLSPHHLEGGCDIVFQIGTAKYGVRNPDGSLSDDRLREVAAHEAVRMFELKLSQGAKPGKGGILPGAKVTAEIAGIRGIREGEDSISPNRHPEIRTVSQLLDMIGRIRDVSGKPTGFKSVVGDVDWLEEMCIEIHGRGIESAPDFITVDGGDGGTGAAPMPLIDNVGLSVKEALPMLSDTLHRYGLRKRIRVIASGKLVTPAEVGWALATGADFVTSARGFMFALGCIQSLKCNKNTCPTGITTHNTRLQKGLDPTEKSVRVASYCRKLIREVQVISHSCGVVRPRLMTRKHVRVVQSDGRSVPMNVLCPMPEVLPEYSDP